MGSAYYVADKRGKSGLMSVFEGNCGQVSELSLHFINYYIL